MKIIRVKTPEEGAYRAVALLNKYIDKKTLVLLSGGKTSFFLYQLLANSVDFKPGAVALVDERSGREFHENSNEKMIKGTGLFNYLKSINVPVYRILGSANYHQVVKSLFQKFPKKLAIMGIGEDGHTAGIAPNRKDFKNPILADKKSLVASFNDKTGSFGQRITLTFKALSIIDSFIILAFGENKKEALQKMLDEKTTDRTKVPAIFFRQTRGRTILITDQKW